MDYFKNCLDVVGKKKRVNVFLSTLGLIGLLFPFTQHLFFPLTPYIKEEFGSTDTITQLAISVPSFIMALMTLIYGSISDRCGRLPVLIVGIILYALGGLLSALAPSITFLIIARLIQGAGAACGMVLARAIARDVFGMEHLVRIIAFLTMMISIGSMIAPVLSSFLVEYTDWRAVMFFSSAFGAIIAVLAWANLNETNPIRNTKKTHNRFFTDYILLFKNIRFTAFVLQSGFISAAFFSLASANSLLMNEFLNLPTTDFGLFFLLFPIGYLLGNFTSSQLSGRVSIENMIFAGSLLLIVTSSVFGAWVWLISVNAWVLFVPGFFITFAQGLALPSAQTGAIGTIPSLSGTAAGIGVFMQMFWPGVFVQLYGFLSDGTPTPVAIIVLIASCLSLLSAVIIWITRD
tara:strand:+ start:1164 stop:2378 length:1215 start_codon:yes stop_codon:yes gene_type:complete